MNATARAQPPWRFEADGGTLVLLEPSHDLPLVSIVVSLRCGSASDPADKVGLARIAMRMLRRGCEGLSSEQIDFRIDALGAELAVDVSASTVALHAQVIARNLGPFVDLLARLLGSPVFADDELQRLKRETVAEIIESRDSDRVVAQKALQRTLFEGHPDSRNAAGTIPTVQAITRQDVLDFYRSRVVRGNIVVGLAGDLSPEAAPAVVNRLLGGIPPGGAVMEDIADPSMPPGRRLLIVDKPERTQTQILIATLGTSVHDDDHIPLVVANAVFGGTFTSRLMREIRSKRGWAYGASSRAAIDRRRQAWVLWTFPAASDAAPCLKLAVDLAERWTCKGVTPRETKFIQNFFVRSHAFDIDTATKRLHQALDTELLAFPANYFTDWVSNVRAVTATSATEAVRKRISTDDLLAVVVGTASQVLDPLRSAMDRLGEVTVVPFDVE